MKKGIKEPDNSEKNGCMSRVRVMKWDLRS